ncbi:ABC transporter substrate-binding protein [Gulosibacter faecalis]|uniref:ABC transporter substrate-binding protein n=1 Tax=Gulosibacter faecalis TaxID=272240 RepID=A0ABW5V3P1_9MICO|nr:ABC transporter substrate-binding protein [Gulosibacter faecalis]
MTRSAVPKQSARLARGAIAAVPIVALLSGCTVANSQIDSGVGALEGDTVRVVLQQEPPTLEACEANLTSTGVVVRSNITEPLVEREPSTGELEPLLSTGWEQTSDTEWVFTMREGVTFHDGEKFDAAAAAHSIDRAVNSELGCNVEGYVFGDSDLGLDVVDSTTLKITTEEPDPILPLKLSFIEIVSPATSDTEKVREPAGTGPYEIANWNAGNSIHLNQFADYWGDKPEFPNVEYVWRGEASVRAAMVTNGEADIATGLSQDDGIGDYGVSYPNNETVGLRFQGNVAPLDDIRVRQAINYAIDRQGIIDALYPNGDQVAAQLIPEGVVGHNDSLEPWPFDVEKAKELVEEARADGTPVDTEINLVVRTAQFPKIQELAEILQGELAEIGLNINLLMLETSQHLQYQTAPFVTNQGPVILMIQHGNQAGDAQFSTDQYFLSDGPQSEFGTEEFDAMIDAARPLSDEERQEAYEEIFKYENEEIVQLAFISHQTGMLGISHRIHYTPNSASGDELRISTVTSA